MKGSDMHGIEIFGNLPNHFEKEPAEVGSHHLSGIVQRYDRCSHPLRGELVTLFTLASRVINGFVKAEIDAYTDALIKCNATTIGDDVEQEAKQTLISAMTYLSQVIEFNRIQLQRDDAVAYYQASGAFRRYDDAVNEVVYPAERKELK